MALGSLVDALKPTSRELRWHTSGWRYEQGFQRWELFFHYRDYVIDGFPYFLFIKHLDKPGKLAPITNDQRKKMQFPKARGPLEETLFNARLGIATADAGEPEYLFEAYFLDGRFKYAGEFGSPGAPNYHCLGIDYRSAREFLDGVKKPLKMRSDREFLQFFEDRTLPETHKSAIRELVELR